MSDSQYTGTLVLALPLIPSINLGTSQFHVCALVSWSETWEGWIKRLPSLSSSSKTLQVIISYSYHRNQALLSQIADKQILSTSYFSIQKDSASNSSLKGKIRNKNEPQRIIAVSLELLRMDLAIKTFKSTLVGNGSYRVFFKHKLKISMGFYVSLVSLLP